MPPIPVIVSERDAIRLYAQLKDAVAKLRGFDIVKSKGKSIRIPRTTNADVRMLLTRWTGALIAGGLLTGRKAAWAKVRDKWAPAAEQMLAQASAGEPDEIFADNIRFWNASAKLAIELRSLQVEIPSAWDMAFESLAEAIVEAPQVIADVAGKVARGAGKAAGIVAGGFFEGLGVVGVALIAGGIYYATKKKRG